MCSLPEDQSPRHDGCGPAAGPPLALVLDGVERPVAATDVTDAAARQALDAAAEAAAAVEVRLGAPLLDQPDGARVQLIDLVVTLARRPGTVLVAGGRPAADPLAAVGRLARFVPEDARRSAAGYAGVVDALALSDPASLSVAAQTAAALLKAAGYQGMTMAALAKAAARRRADLARAARPAGKLVVDVLGDAPAPPGLVVPDGYTVGPDGVRVEGGAVLPEPLLVVGRGEDGVNGVHTLTLAYRLGDRWLFLEVDRSQVADGRKAVDLADRGVGVTSTTAKAFVDYVAAFEQANRSLLPAVRLVPQMGWTAGLEGFVLGHRYLTAARVYEPDDRDAPVRFRGADPGSQAVAELFRTAGTLDGWRAAMAPLTAYPRVQLAVVAALAAPLLEVIGCPNPVLDLAGATSSGKTTALRAAAGVFGDPEPTHPHSYLGTWNGTRVGLERTVGVLAHLPVLLDDSMQVANPADAADVVYLATQGTSRRRGTVRGLAAPDHFRTALLSSGEQQLTEFTQAGGTRARVIPVWGSPFGDTGPAAAAAVRALRAGVADHHGHAGPAFIRYLLANRRHWDQWRAEFAAREAVLQARAGGNAVAGRMARTLAGLSLAHDLAVEAGVLPWAGTANPVDALFDELVGPAAQADRPLAALQLVVQTAVANPAAYLAAGRPTDPPPGGWHGRWLSGKTGVELQLDPGRMNTLLEANGFQAAACKRVWRDNGWLVVPTGPSERHRTDMKVWFAGHLTRLVCLTPAGVTAGSD